MSWNVLLYEKVGKTTIRAVQNRQLPRYTYMEKRTAQLQVL